MTLLIAWMVIYGLHLDWYFYWVAILVWIPHLIAHQVK